MNVKVYVEGGGDRRELRTKCRQGFSSFFRKAGLDGRLPRIVACGSRHQAYDRFCSAIAHQPEDVNFLLVDSEGPVHTNAWEHLAQRDGWSRPSGASDESAHLMVQMMESWFLADRDCLARYFGNGFNANALPAPQKAIEDISKDDLERALDESPRQSSKRRYAKGRDSFALLGQIDAAKVIVASPHARRLVEAMSGCWRIQRHDCARKCRLLRLEIQHPLQRPHGACAHFGVHRNLVGAFFQG